MSDINVKRTKTVFVAIVGNEEEGEKPFLRYEIDEKNRVIKLIETYTPPKLRGRGIAEKLVDEAVKFAKENELKIEPICSYAIYYFIKHSEKRDLLVDWMKNKNEEELKKIFDEAIQRERK